MVSRPEDGPPDPGARHLAEQKARRSRVLKSAQEHYKRLIILEVIKI